MVLSGTGRCRLLKLAFVCSGGCLFAAWRRARNGSAIGKTTALGFETEGLRCCEIWLGRMGHGAANGCSPAMLCGHISAQHLHFELNPCIADPTVRKGPTSMFLQSGPATPFAAFVSLQNWCHFAGRSPGTVCQHTVPSIRFPAYGSRRSTCPPYSTSCDAQPLTPSPLHLHNLVRYTPHQPAYVQGCFRESRERHKRTF